MLPDAGWDRDAASSLEPCHDGRSSRRNLASRIRHEFFANVSHELRTPLGGVLTAVAGGTAR